jgi:hypothetical protein
LATAASALGCPAPGFAACASGATAGLARGSAAVSGETTGDEARCSGKTLGAGGAGGKDRAGCATGGGASGVDACVGGASAGEPAGAAWFAAFVADVAGASSVWSLKLRVIHAPTSPSPAMNTTGRKRRPSSLRARVRACLVDPPVEARSTCGRTSNVAGCPDRAAATSARLPCVGVATTRHEMLASVLVVAIS